MVDSQDEHADGLLSENLMRRPTIVPLAEEGMVALHSVIAEDVFWDVMENLKKAGASDIVVVPIETIIK